MKLSNLAFFCTPCHLQNANTLHNRFYAILQNKQATSSNPFALKQIFKPVLLDHTDHTTQNISGELELIYDDMPAHEVSLTPANQASLDMQQLLQTEHTDERGLWKLGRGAIEKVDRNSGDIFHLCEDADIMPEDNLHCSVA